jgi:hypothetical protein
MGTSHEPLQLDKSNLVQWKTTDLPTSFTWVASSFSEVLNMATVRNAEIILGQILNHNV